MCNINQILDYLQDNPHCPNFGFDIDTGVLWATFQPGHCPSRIFDWTHEYSYADGSSTWVHDIAKEVR